MKHHTVATMLANAYLHSPRAPQAIRTIKMLSFIGIALGTCALMLALIITSGFERDISLKMKGISSDVVIESPGNQLHVRDIESYLRQHLGSVIQGVSGSSTRHLIVTSNDHSHVLFLRGIEPEQEALTTTLQDKIITPHGTTLATLLKTPGSLLIGKQCAQQNRLWLDNEVTVYIPQEAGKSKIALDKKIMHLTGIFYLGLEDYDMNIAYCSHETLQSMYDKCLGADQIAVTFAPRHCSWWEQLLLSDADYAVQQITAMRRLLPGLSVRSWKELYPDLVASLQLEKYAMAIAQGLIALVASMLIICLLFMFLQYKRTDIAILKTLGMTDASIGRLFTRIGMTIVAQAVGTGLAAAWTIGWIIDTYKPITLPDIYYIAYLPAALEPLHALLVGGGTLLLGYAACQLPLQSLRSISVASVLRGN